MPDENTTKPVKLRQTTDARRAPVKARFPGPASCDVPLRIAIDKGAYAEVIAHAKGSLDAEVCGILAGVVGIDAAGRYLHITAAIRGSAARQGSTHVTFTQETWTRIHETMEKEHRDSEILGWYHSHPGFGVEFSEMDLFIQRNFFGADTQVALVFDPVGGDVAVCFNDASGIRPIDRFWVDGREQRCRPAADKSESKSAAGGSVIASESSTAERLDKVEQRLSQALQALDEQTRSNYRLATFTAALIGVAVVGYIAWLIYSQLTSDYKPPEVNSFAPIPVMVDGKPVVLGVAVVKWQIPPELNAAYVQVERERREAAERLTTQPATSPSADVPR